MSSTTTFQVRSATLRDAKAIAEIQVQAIHAFYKGVLPDDDLCAITVEKRQPFWREAIEFSEPQVLVATEGDRVIGFVGFDRSRDRGTPPAVGEIWAIYLDPAHWGKGVGLSLWDAARDGLAEEGCTKVTLWLSLSNERVLRFFELAGFKRELPSAKTVPMGAVKVEEIRLKRTIS